MELLTWSDWIIITILIAFTTLGFKRGMAQELINLGFLLLAVILAWLFYQTFYTFDIITWISVSNTAYMAIAFAVIFIGVLLTKVIINRLATTSISIQNPCALNKLLALIILIVIVITISAHYLEFATNLDIMQTLIIHDGARIGLSFIMLSAIIMSVFYFLLNVLNISVDTSGPCLLSGIFTKIINALQILNTKLNAKNISSTKNNILGVLIGFIKGSLAIFTAVLILQNINGVSQQPYWIQAKGVLLVLQQEALKITPELSKHLLFITKKE